MQHAHQPQAVVDRAPAVASGTGQAAEERRLPTVEEHRPRTLEGTAAGVGRFLLHFLEMWIAMGIGMAVFGPLKQALVAQGYAALLDTSSIDFQAWMNLFMIVPMVAWMRVRGHGWRMGASAVDRERTRPSDRRRVESPARSACPPPARTSAVRLVRS